MSYEKRFDELNNHPNYWYNKASDLHAAAGAIWYSMDTNRNSLIVNELGLGDWFSMSLACRPVFEMVIGYSFELLYKAIIKSISKQFGHIHILGDLAKLAEAELSEYEMEIMKYLTECVIWEGRYPIPKTSQTFKSHSLNAMNLLFDEIDCGTIKLKKYNGIINWDELNVIWGRLSEKYHNNMITYETLPNKQ